MFVNEKQFYMAGILPAGWIHLRRHLYEVYVLYLIKNLFIEYKGLWENGLIFSNVF